MSGKTVGGVRRGPVGTLARGLAWRKVVSAVFLYVIGFLGELCLPPLKVALTLRELLHPGGVGRVWGWVIEGICVERVS